MLLCDAVQNAGGKLYILGGGWSILTRNNPEAGFNMGLAVKLSIPWSLANERMEILTKLVNDEGEPVLAGERPVEIRGEVEAGRPAGHHQGAPLDLPLALNVNSVKLDPGGYCWELRVANQLIDRQAFRVVEPR